MSAIKKHGGAPGVRAVAAGAMLAGVLTLGACGTSDAARAREGADPPPLQVRSRPMTEPIARSGGAVDLTTSAALLERQRLAAAPRGAERETLATFDDASGPATGVKYAAREAAADDALRVLIGDYMGRGYLIDAEVSKDKVTLDIDAMMTPRDMQDLLEALAVINGWTVEDRGSALVVTKSAKDAARSSMAPLLSDRAAAPSEAPGVRVFRLTYLSATDATNVCKDLMSQGGKGVAAGRLLVIADRISQLNRLGELIRALDQPAFDGVEIWTYGLERARPEDAAKTLDAMARAAGMASSGEPIVAFVPVTGTRKLMAIARDPSVQPLVRNWVEQIDRPSDDPTRQTYLYRMQNFDPEQLLGMIRGYLGSRYAGPTDEFDAASDQVRITVSSEEDVMLIDARHRDYTDLLALLTRLDIPRQQVQMECLIAEVTLGGSLQWGVEYFLETIMGEGILELAGNLTGLGPLFPTGTASFVGGSGFALIKVLEGESHVEVLSTPRFTTRDKEEAEFQVGASVPILKASVDSTTQTDGTSGVRNEVEYRDTGLILRAQPRINETGDVTLKISLEIADAAPNTTSDIDSPQFTKRLIETTVTVRHGQTLLLAGNVNKRVLDKVNKIPVLGSIPIAGIMFQNIDKSTERTELILTVTPPVINDPSEATALVEGFASHLPGLREALAEFDAPLPGVMTFGPGGVAPARSFDAAGAGPAQRPDVLAGAAEPEAQAPTDRKPGRTRRPAPVDRSETLLALRRAVSEESGESEDDAQVEVFIDALLAAARPAEGK